MYIQDIIKKLNVTAVRMGNVDYYPSYKVADELHKLEESCIQWSIEDFEQQAYSKKGENWPEYYDRTKFIDALERMIYKHDATIGITWDTVDYYLDEMCTSRTAEGMRMDVYNSTK